MKLDHDVMNVYLPLKWVGDGRKRGVTINTPSLLRSQEIVRLRFPNGLPRGPSLSFGSFFAQELLAGSPVITSAN